MYKCVCGCVFFFSQVKCQVFKEKNISNINSNKNARKLMDFFECVFLQVDKYESLVSRIIERKNQEKK